MRGARRPRTIPSSSMSRMPSTLRAPMASRVALSAVVAAVAAQLPGRDRERSGTGSPARLLAASGGEVTGRVVAFREEPGCVTHAVRPTAPILPGPRNSRRGENARRSALEPRRSSSSYLRAYGTSSHPDAAGRQVRRPRSPSPASFDEARESLTIVRPRPQASRRHRLLEEPQAAFYDGCATRRVGEHLSRVGRHRTAPCWSATWAVARRPLSLVGHRVNADRPRRPRP